MRGWFSIRSGRKVGEASCRAGCIDRALACGRIFHRSNHLKSLPQKRGFLGGFLLILQGAAELVRCWRAMKHGVWMERVEDVKETEDALMEQQASS